ncbi:MAG: GAF domain-containing sensor histidine kinase [Anaerolineae bacterium]|nr:GAF domain-containing sensor histidine kinase [Anaerolineae bacterium]
MAEDLAPLAVALGLAMIAWRLRHLPQPSPFLTFIGFSIAVASGKLGLLGSDVGMRLYFISLAGAAPAFFLLHHRLLGEPLGRRSRRVLAALLGLALGLALPPALASFAVLAEQPWYSLWRGMVRLSAALSVLVSGAWLVFSWRRDWPEVKLRPLRLVTYGNIVAFAPLVLLSMLPDTFHSPVYVPYEITLFGSLLSPLCYSHAFTMTGAPGHGVRLRFLSVYLMLAVLLTFVLLVAMAAFTVAGLPVGQAWAIALLVASAAIVAVGPSTRRWFTGLSEWTWFGRGPGYDQILDRLSETLSTTLDQERLRRMLVSELVRELGLSGAALFLKDSTGHLRLVEAVGSMHLENADLAVPVDGPLVEHLSTHPRPVTQDGLRQALASHSLGMAERFLLAMEPPLWVPLVSGGEAYGLLLVGPKTDADFFTPDDVRLLTLLGYRAGVAAHNVLLMKELRRSHEQLSRAHQRLLDAVEQERRRLAHELHDGAVQQLLAVTYHVAHYRHTLADDGGEQSSAVQAASEALDSLRQELLAVVTQLRSSISGLRPAGLDDLGLAAALAGYVSRLEQEHLGRMPEIELDLDEGSARLPSRVSLCLFRVAQEALRNAIRHSRADFVRVRLRVEAERVHLLVSDDGQGFVVPERLSQLTGEGHFGLLSISERVSLLPGKLTIRSRPDYGTEISVDVDLSEVDPSD